jgi:hypothetical protein
MQHLDLRISRAPQHAYVECAKTTGVGAVKNRIR